MRGNPESWWFHPCCLATCLCRMSSLARNPSPLWTPTHQMFLHANSPLHKLTVVPRSNGVLSLSDVGAVSGATWGDYSLRAATELSWFKIYATLKQNETMASFSRHLGGFAADRGGGGIMTGEIYKEMDRNARLARERRTGRTGSDRIHAKSLLADRCHPTALSGGLCPRRNIKMITWLVNEPFTACYWRNLKTTCKNFFFSS